MDDQSKLSAPDRGPAPTGAPAEPAAEPAADAEPRYEGYRPAEFRPAVFVPAEPVPYEAGVDGVAPPHDAPPSALAPPPPPPARRSRISLALARFGEELAAWFKTLVSAAVYATLIVTFGFQVARVEGQSMVPTLDDQDRLIVNKAVYLLSDPRFGDVVMLYYPEDPDKSFVKRVVAEEGDTIRSVQGRVYRNEVPLDDEFIPEEFRSFDTWGPIVVTRGYYFVMGDHRNNSSDSRAWGLVPKKYIIGKVQLRWWPVNHARLF